MQALIDDIGPRLDVNGAEMGFYDTQVDRYEAQLHLDDDDSEQNYDPRMHG